MSLSVCLYVGMSARLGRQETRDRKDLYLLITDFLPRDAL